MSEAKKVFEGVWNLFPDPPVPFAAASYLVVGTEKALLIDSGANEANIPELVKAVTDLPVELINTHAHGDHTAGNHWFDSFYISPADMPFLNDDLKAKAKPVNEGDTFDLGGRVLEVIATPGHTPGSLSLIDRENKIIFTGDMVALTPVFFVPGMSDIDQFISSQQKYVALADTVEKVFVCHGPSTTLESSVFANMLEAAEGFKAGTLAETPADGPMPGAIRLTPAGFGFICPGAPKA